MVIPQYIEGVFMLFSKIHDPHSLQKFHVLWLPSILEHSPEFTTPKDERLRDAPMHWRGFHAFFKNSWPSFPHFMYCDYLLFWDIAQNLSTLWVSTPKDERLRDAPMHWRGFHDFFKNSWPSFPQKFHVLWLPSRNTAQNLSTLLSISITFKH